MKRISRRELITNAGMALGGAVTATAFLGACSGTTQATAQNPPTDGTTPGGGTPVGPQVADFPYRQFIPAGFTFDKAAIKENSYQLYWVGGCGHGAYKAIMQELAQKVGAPFNLLSLDQAIYMGGGIAGYGSICGAINGGLLAINSIVAEPAVRSAMMIDLMRWYEGNSFPAYVPTTINAAEAGKTKLDFSAANIAKLQVVPHNHLCHASRSQWCQMNGVPASSPDLSARCGRLTADVTGKVVDQLTAYLSSGSYTAAAIDSASAQCGACHTPTTTSKSVASGMRCDSCHSDKVSNHSS